MTSKCRESASGSAGSGSADESSSSAPDFQLDEELHALEAIYGQNFLTIEQVTRHEKIISVDLRSNVDAGRANLHLRFRIPLNNKYPTISPPTFEISCPQMKADQKSTLSSCLEQIYADNLHQPILYLWIEAARNKLDAILSDPEKIVYEIDEPEIDQYSDQLQAYVCLATSDAGPNENEEDDLEIPEILSGEPITDRKSTFQAHIAYPVCCKEQIKRLLVKLKQNAKVERATHNIYAYKIKDPSTGVSVQDCADDGETHAGGRLLHLLEMMQAYNVLVVVSRWYGGIHLGADRFKHINNVARDLLEENGFGKKHHSSDNGNGKRQQPSTSNQKKSTKGYNRYR